jgi:vanillate O-demethylase monooxygenase subunit
MGISRDKSPAKGTRESPRESIIAITANTATLGATLMERKLGMKPFLDDAWYMAGWSAELTDKTLARTMLDVPIVLYRQRDGMPVALYNQCPHRFAPLSKGIVKDDTLQCGYHGLTFDRTGSCVFSPYTGKGLAAAKVRSFPVYEQDRMLWVWMGAADESDIALIPRFPHHDDPQMRVVYGSSHVRANYELVADNLMDLSHTTFIHPSFGGEFWVPKYTLEQEQDTVIANYQILDSPSSEFSEAFFAAKAEAINEYTKMRWNAPASMLLDIRWAFSKEPSQIVAIQPSTHVLTPESQTTTHYFWASGAELEAPISDDEHRAVLVQAFDVEDTPMLEACAQSMGARDFWSMKPLLLPYDTAAVRARRLLRKKIDERNETVTIKSGA